MSADANDPVEIRLRDGIRDRWYAICPSDWVRAKPISLKRLGTQMAIWRDSSGKLHALEDRCPHRGAHLSQGQILGDSLKCPYHGVEVRGDGVAVAVPGSPGCKLEGSRATRNFPIFEHEGAIFVYNGTKYTANPPEFKMPTELTDDGTFSRFLCYMEWKCDYRYVLDNVVDPMHGTFLHKQSHSMFEGDISAKFDLTDLEDGFLFAKKGQKGVNFDWSEFHDSGAHWGKLEIPYPKKGGPGSGFIIIAMATPIMPNLCGVFFWRVRNVPKGWARDTWRFLYRDRLEGRHWHVVEQDRVLLEELAPNANDPKEEHLYDHDMGLVRLRRIMRSLAKEQVQAEAGA